MSLPNFLSIQFLHAAFSKYNLKSLRFLISGAAPLSGSLVKATVAKLKSVGATVVISQGQITQCHTLARDLNMFGCIGYGLTETTPTSHVLDLEHYLSKLGSVGRILPNLEARLVREDGVDVEEGQPGELWLRGPSVMKVRGHVNP